MDYGIKIQVRCPACGKSLMDPAHPIDKLDAIKLLVKIGSKIGHLYLSQIYGSYHKHFEGVEDLDQAIVECSCCHCHAPFPVHQRCADCQAPIIGLDLAVGGMIKVCSRNGCKRHSLEFDNVEDALNLFRTQDQTGFF